ncbi:hypothetical protein CROQUDRAFT_100771 [Cronartium quercuum f. sp. fusiforme G11]|uniref:Uncharacterized protein n=1 Tax=Cronartium quercuum f. sp. fusiforme G11 TaxID=708437 RepID=A0A9P6T712_9BASI|nr:hypothetical protein CROQUDRAFT_100771 [Cronartium quercuum f. sp. fusiforme G11]
MHQEGETPIASKLIKPIIKYKRYTLKETWRGYSTSSILFLQKESMNQGIPSLGNTNLFIREASEELILNISLPSTPAIDTTSTISAEFDKKLHLMPNEEDILDWWLDEAASANEYEIRQEAAAVSPTPSAYDGYNWRFYEESDFDRYQALLKSKHPSAGPSFDGHRGPTNLTSSHPGGTQQRWATQPTPRSSHSSNRGSQTGIATRSYPSPASELANQGQEQAAFHYHNQYEDHQPPSVALQVPHSSPHSATELPTQTLVGIRVHQPSNTLRRCKAPPIPTSEEPVLRPLHFMGQHSHHSNRELGRRSPTGERGGDNDSSDRSKRARHSGAYATGHDTVGPVQVVRQENTDDIRRHEGK